MPINPFATGAKADPYKYLQPLTMLPQAIAQSMPQAMSSTNSQSYTNPTPPPTASSTNSQTYANPFTENTFDQTGYGTGEQFYQNVQGDFQQPTRTEEMFPSLMQNIDNTGEAQRYWQEVQGQFNMPTSSQAVFGQLNEEGGGSLDPYFDRARQQTAGSINDQLAARGGYGSSAGVTQISEAMAGLSAEQAMQQLAADQQHNQLLAQVAGQADQSLMNQIGTGAELANLAQGDQMEILQAQANLAALADQSEANRLTQGMDQASLAQQLKDIRVQNYLSNIMAPLPLAVQSQQMSLANMFGSDQELFDSALAYALGEATEGQAQDYRDREELFQDLGLALQVAGAVSGGGAGSFTGANMPRPGGV